MDPITHLRIQEQARTSFERSVRDGRVGQRAGRGNGAAGDTLDGDGASPFVSLVRLLHLRHA